MNSLAAPSPKRERFRQSWRGIVRKAVTEEVGAPFNDQETVALADGLADYLDAYVLTGRLRPEAIEEGVTGALPMAQVDDSPPPDPLVGEFMATREATVLYAPGGSGKGMTASWLALQHLRTDPQAVVYILDFEHHDTEWAGRLRRMGATDEELACIHYASPFAREWTARRGPLVEVAEHVREDCDRLGATLLVVDSYSMATSSGDTLGGQASAVEYFGALATIGRRSLTLAHVTGSAERWPDKPFGSVFVHNLARETWAAAQVEIEGGAAQEERGLTYMRVELRCKKASGRARPEPQVLTFTFEPDFGPITVTAASRRLGRSELVYEALHKTPDQWMTGAAIVKAIKSDTGETISEAQVYDVIRKDRRDRYEKNETKRPFLYRAA